MCQIYLRVVHDEARRLQLPLQAIVQVLAERQRAVLRGSICDLPTTHKQSEIFEE